MNRLIFALLPVLLPVWTVIAPASARAGMPGAIHLQKEGLVSPSDKSGCGGCSVASAAVGAGTVALLTLLSFLRRRR